MKSLAIRIWIGVSLLLLCAANSFGNRPLPPLRIAEGHLVDDRQNPVRLRGCNLGNWLLLELWMLDLADQSFTDQYELEALLAKRFGEDGRAKLMELFREHWITEADFARIRSFGMNLVRLPFEYALLEDDAHPMELKEDAWRWLDRAVEWSEQHGLYIILDLHGAAGRQSDMDHTGRRDRNELWTSGENQARTVWLWTEVARRYRDRPAVLAYDVLNEPWGSSHDQLRDMVSRCFHAIRAVDPNTPVILPGHYDGIDLYGDPRELGWEQVMFTMHWYPGFFGWGRPGPHVHKDFLEGGVQEWGEKMAGLQAPLLVGEFNVVHKRSGGGEMMRRYFDAYNDLGWPATMWSYKVLTRSGGIGSGVWGMVTNQDPLDTPDLETASQEAIADYFRSFSTMAMQEDADLKHWLTTDETPSSLDDLPPLPPALTVAPAHDPLPHPWQATDIGDSLAGGQSTQTQDQLVVYGGGDDIWRRSDQFRFVWQTVTGDVAVATQVIQLSDTHHFAKAGVMIRGSLDPQATHVLLNAFPGGGIEFSYRKLKGRLMKAEAAGQARFPDVHLKLVRRGARISAFTANESREWRPCGSVEIPALGETVWVGLATLSHNYEVLTQATFGNPSIEPLPAQ